MFGDEPMDCFAREVAGDMARLRADFDEHAKACKAAHHALKLRIEKLEKRISETIEDRDHH